MSFSFTYDSISYLHNFRIGCSRVVKGLSLTIQKWVHDRNLASEGLVWVYKPRLYRIG